MQNSSPSEQQQDEPRWRPLSSVQRRVVGVLVEKAKTTPEAYPLSLNAITNACNQKNNRDPLMSLEADEVEVALDELREIKAVGEVVGGRVAKYRHYLYDWLGVDKVELAVMAELLLRGPQTVGQLRGRAARMEPIADLGALQPILASLEGKGLAVALTPSGRGQIVTHRLLSDQEMDELQKRHGSSPAVTAGSSTSAFIEQGPSPGPAAQSRPMPPSPSPAGQPSPAAAAVPPDVVSELRVELAELRADVARLRKEIEDLWASIR